MKHLLFALGLIVTSSVANAASEPDVLLKNAADNMIALLENNRTQLESDEHFAHQIVRENLVPLVDTKGLGKRVLKRKVWDKLDDVQRTRFTDAFVDHIIKTYAQGLNNYDGHTFNFIKTNFSRTRQTAWVYSELVSKESESFSIIYTLKMMEDYDDWKVIDISVEGVKILQNYREQLKSVDVEKGFDALLAKLEQNEK
ncbi:MlaC/ttg2D family ABC transporter substrate-binding protein [Pleionea sediminis]|uniref:MlaC/ttg2D family ABC transporter substrate-binding protein n=1 Tax=Pleionea sediminis TaxID=2569479 RepID=UPI001185948C|nr:ABC transporter substrate-binding protein [Pleionea sediminis]